MLDTEPKTVAEIKERRFWQLPEVRPDIKVYFLYARNLSLLLLPIYVFVSAR